MMNHKAFGWITSALIILISTGVMSCSEQPYIAKKSRNWLAHKPDPSAQKVHTIFGIGDAGKASRQPLEPVLKLLQQQLEAAEHPATALFLGDNTYNHGLPEEGAEDREEAESHLCAQLDILNNFNGNAFFLPGNHDWNESHDGGWEAVCREENFIEGYMKLQDIYQPDGGCPGPVEIQVDKKVTIIFIDVEWFLTKYDKPESAALGCEINSRNEFFGRMLEVLDRHRDEFVIVAAHHPMRTYGPHGGRTEALEVVC